MKYVRTLLAHNSQHTLYEADTWEGPEGVCLIEVSLYIFSLLGYY